MQDNRISQGVTLGKLEPGPAPVEFSAWWDLPACHPRPGGAEALAAAAAEAAAEAGL
jgi:hypothetical protein